MITLLIIALASMATVSQKYTISIKTAAAQVVGPPPTTWSFSASSFPTCNFTNALTGVALNSGSSPVAVVSGFVNADTITANANSSSFTIGASAAIAQGAAAAFNVTFTCTSPPNTINYTLLTTPAAVFPTNTVTFNIVSGSEKIAAFALLLLLLL